jgi:predicted lipoprotein with Yx(FWY)xxD motif
MRKTLTRLGIVVAGAMAVLLVIVATSGAAHHRTVNVVKTAQNTSLSETILVTMHGRTLYHLTGETTTHWMCARSCTSLWPPLLVPSRARHSKLGKVRGLGKARRPDGKLQVTYKGHPLYTFANDHAAGDAKGQGFGGVWFVIKHAAASTTSTSTTTTPPPSGYGTTNPYPY